jgi:hypothetical protein
MRGNGSIEQGISGVMRSSLPRNGIGQARIDEGAKEHLLLWETETPSPPRVP